MIQPRNTSCVECIQISTLLGEIDCKIMAISKLYYNNIIYLLNIPINTEVILNLLNYKRILTYKMYNEDYAPDYTVEMIASKIKNLKYK